MRIRLTLDIERRRGGEVSDLDTRDDILELAERYETTKALDLTAKAEAAVRTKPGSRVPPGAQEMLDDDELTRAFAEVDDWAEFCAHVLVDELDLTTPDETAKRLRLLAQHVAHFTMHDEVLIACDFGPAGKLEDLLRMMRRLSTRGERRVQTGHRCQTGCGGQYAVPLREDKTGDALVCDRCGHLVPYSVWSSWPRARVTYVTVEHAARMAGTTVDATSSGQGAASGGAWGPGARCGTTWTMCGASEWKDRHHEGHHDIVDQRGYQRFRDLDGDAGGACVGVLADPRRHQAEGRAGAGADSSPAMGDV